VFLLLSIHTNNILCINRLFLIQ